jgi:hypothetical protein
VSASLEPFKITLSNFAINRAELKEKHRAALDELGRLMRQGSPAGFIVLALGHTDSTGNPGINDPLSRRRAAAVKKILEKKSRVPIETSGLGETQPQADNTSIAGRSDNRRVEIHFLYTGPTDAPEPESTGDVVNPPTPTITVDPPPTVTPPPTVDGPPPVKDGPPTIDQPPPSADINKTTPPEEKDEQFCESYPILCTALIGAAELGALEIGADLLIAGLLGAGLWAGLKRLWPERRGPQPPQQPTPPHPCAIFVNLANSTSTSPPGPNIPATLLGSKFMATFPMTIVFLDDPSQGCECALGEYHQEVKGYFEDVDVSGNVTRPPHPILNGPLDANNFGEDGAPYMGMGSISPYGHRDWPPRNTFNDQFLPDRQIGCTYKGDDNPGSPIGGPGAIVRIHLEFRGVAVDRRTRTPIPGQPWYYWTVIDSYQTPGLIPPVVPHKKRGAKKPPPSPAPGSEPEITPAPTPYDACPVNGIEIGCQAREFLDYWESPDRDIYLPKVLEAIEIEKSRLVILYVRDSGVSWEELVLSPEFQDLQEQARRTACKNVFTVVDMTDLISVDCDL